MWSAYCSNAHRRNESRFIHLSVTLLRLTNNKVARLPLEVIPYAFEMIFFKVRTPMNLVPYPLHYIRFSPNFFRTADGNLKFSYSAHSIQDQLLTTTPVSGGMGMHLLQKMVSNSHPYCSVLLCCSQGNVAPILIGLATWWGIGQRKERISSASSIGSEARQEGSGGEWRRECSVLLPHMTMDSIKNDKENSLPLEFPTKPTETS